jgi:7-dehydrocholesterol reductase
MCYVPDYFVDGFYLCLFHNFHEFDSSNQRYMFHQENHGKCILLGGVQHKIIIFYMTKKGKTCEILLSADEWWYISHPFISFIKILVRLPSVSLVLVGPSFCIMYLMILLMDCAYCDHDHYHKKFGKHWDEYCEIVPYNIIPRIM